MAKKNRSSDQPPLSHYWTPPAVDVDGGVGEPWACLTTTYEFDAEFFETELLPRFLGLKFDHTENEASFLVEREEALALARVAVLVDHSRFDSKQTTLRWDQVPIQIPGGIQHAKITVLAWKHLIRVVLGSANLTRGGYRRNREMFAVLDFWNSSDSTPLRLLTDTLDLLALMLTWSRTAIASVERTRDTLADLRRRSRSWTDAPVDFTPRERPRAMLAATHPRTRAGQAARSALDEAIESWGNRRATSVTVVTPSTAPNPDSQSGDAVVNRLADLPMTRECEGRLVVPELLKTPEDQRSRVEVSEVFKESWRRVFGGRGGGFVLPLPLCIEGREDRNRRLHSKCVVLENEDDDVALLMVGSSNFTPRGMGIGVYNFEANLVFEDDASAKNGGLRLVDRLGLPRSWDEVLALDDVAWLAPKNPPEDDPDPYPALPSFFAWATFSQKTGELKLGLERGQPEPQHWLVRLPGDAADVTTLFARNFAAADSSPSVLSHVLPEAMRAVSIVALVVNWHDDGGVSRSAKLGVTVESAEHLLPPEEFRKLSADAIIECLITGKTPAQWFDQKQGRTTPARRNDAAIESLRAVDTSSFLLYRVRRFGRALTGMAQRILRTLAVPAAIRYRLMQDPFGPVSLARSLTRSSPEADVDEGGWSASLAAEHRLFLLAEILLTITHLQPRIIRTAKKGKEREVLTDVFQSAIGELRALVEQVRSEAAIPENLRDYLARVETLAMPHAESQAAVVTEVLDVD